MTERVLTDHLGKLAGERYWLTSEWGRVWVGCAHGIGAGGANPTRICRECFEEIVRRYTERTAEDSAR